MLFLSVSGIRNASKWSAVYSHEQPTHETTYFLPNICWDLYIVIKRNRFTTVLDR